MSNQFQPQRVAAGIPTVTEVLNGGLVSESATLVRGTPGAGKTIFGLHFLAATDQPVVYINLGEPADYIESTANQFDIDTSHIEFLDLSPSGEQFQGNRSYDLFEPDEVETTSLVEQIRETIETNEPTRVLVDPITEFRHLAPDSRQFRTQVLSLIDFLKNQGTTIVLTSQAAASVPDDDLQFLADTVISLSATDGQRSLKVPKFRGSDFQTGPHTVTISDDGMSVWPKLDPSKHYRDGSISTLSSGINELDALLGGGITTGTISFFSGPTGVGKTTTGLQFIIEAANRGHRSVLYSFEESKRTILTRAEKLGMPLKEQIDAENIVIREIGADELTLDEFTYRVRSEVETEDAEMIMIDGITGYKQAFDEDTIDADNRLIKIGQYLRNMNVTGIVTNEVHQITGDFRATDQNISHLADDIIFLRHVEYKGELQKVIGVLKRRTSDFETTLRRLAITEEGLEVGEPLSELRRILTGTPDWNDD